MFDYVLIPLSILAVVAVLAMGLWNMMRGGSSQRSQSLMRWRVILQFAAIAIAMAAIWASGRGPGG
jgi:hypothetical protein